MTRRGVLSDRILEVLAVLLLGVATVGTAWCGLQSTLWNGEQDDRAMLAANERVEASRLFGLATQTIAYDASMVAQYADAVIAEDDRRQEFLRRVLMRPDFLPFLDAWRAEIRAGRTPNLTADQAYRDSVTKAYREAESRAEGLATSASAAGQVGDSYVLMTVLLAISLFFAGVTSSFRFPVVRLLLLSGSIACLGLATARLVDLPIAASTSGLLPNL